VEALAVTPPGRPGGGEVRVNKASDGPRVAIVTGASAGIGRETALAFARRGWAVTLAARRADRLERVATQCRQAGGEALVAVTDVAEKAQVEAMVTAATERFGRLDVLVNNAGYGVYGQVTDVVEADMRALFDVNFYGVWYGMLAAVPVMKAQGDGHIFNVSSVIGKRATPMHGAYCATKFAVCGLTESARVELRPHGVWVTLVCPSLTETEFFDQGTLALRKRSPSRFTRPMPARAVGEAIAAAAGRYRSEMVFTAGGKLLAWIAGLSPRLGDAMMERYRQELIAAMAEAD